MLNIRSAAEMARALDSPIDLDLRSLLTLRRDQLTGYDGYELGDIASFTIAEISDNLNEITRGLGFDPLANMVDGKRYGDPGFDPSAEWIADHGRWYELVWILSDDGFGAVLFVSKEIGVDPNLLAFCSEYASTAPPSPSPLFGPEQENMTDN